MNNEGEITEGHRHHEGDLPQDVVLGIDPRQAALHRHQPLQILVEQQEEDAPQQGEGRQGKEGELAWQRHGQRVAQCQALLGLPCSGPIPIPLQSQVGRHQKAEGGHPQQHLEVTLQRKVVGQGVVARQQQCSQQVETHLQSKPVQPVAWQGPP